MIMHSVIGLNDYFQVKEYFYLGNNDSIKLAFIHGRRVFVAMMTGISAVRVY